MNSAIRRFWQHHSARRDVCRKCPRSWRAPFERSFACDLSHVSFVTGPAVDRHLAAADAWAQAVDRSTVLLATPITKLGASAQRLVVGHELAHTIQLARGGNTPETLLEDEAWFASRRALQGLSCRIRGGGRRPLCAMAYIDNLAGHAFAVNYYQLYRNEPVPGLGGNVTVNSITSLSSPTLESLLDALIAGPAGDIVIVAHGHPGGLAMPIIPATNGRRGADSNVMLALADSNRNDADAAFAIRDVAITDSVVHRLRQKMTAVQNRQFSRIDFRGCDVGRTPSVLDQMRIFFGATTVTAPKLGSVFGRVFPMVASASFRTVRRDARNCGGGNVYLYGNASTLQHVMGTSAAALTAWIDQSFGNSSAYGALALGPAPGPAVYCHYLLPQRGFIFPEDSAYLANIVEST